MWLSIKGNDKSREYSSRIVNAILKYRKNRNVIFMGVANAGKSTVLNHLLATKDLTTSQNPGTTLDLVQFLLRIIRFMIRQALRIRTLY